jgi:hypothetical protein
MTQVGLRDWEIDFVLFMDLDACVCTSQLQMLNLNRIVALAHFVNVPVAYKENNLAGWRNGMNPINAPHKCTP